ncbi:hypothetical protein SLUN_38780 (plasmid) [Streptomyces lunaelactis]|uniref:Uncharacterized protein n=1 Tax=Streptomyces lunaelactis TaxID=1535768 RepID=A0A2R4TFU1_9ACTN|nr:hypothetical protein [Streptomyces lunaelactis]AVZ77976.1 hypothetical protein SLUN_38780 [Streptomyces lunaelactis]NUK84949.1 hypothetical protein [Streptomyces lunaelactis]
MYQLPPAPGEMPTPTTPMDFLRTHQAYVATTVSAGTLLLLARVWNAQGAQHDTGAAALMIAFGAASGALAFRMDDATAQATAAGGALTFGALAVAVYADPIAPSLIIWAVALIASCILIGRSHREDHREEKTHRYDMEARRLERGVDLSIAQVSAQARIEVAREQSAAVAAIEAAMAHRAALNSGGHIDPVAMLRATGQLPQLPQLSVVHDDDRDRRTA